MLFRSRFKMLEKICNYSERLFMRYGIKSITMDDVAKELSISKKTIYQYVTDKDDLVKKTMLLHIQEIDELSKQIFEVEPNAVLQIIRLAAIVVNNHKEMSPNVLFDLKKYHPETYSFFVQHRETTACTQMRRNLERGVKQGLYRTDMDIETTIRLYMSLMESCASSEITYLNNMSFADKFHKALEYHMHAICTDKGLALFKEELSKLKPLNNQS